MATIDTLPPLAVGSTDMNALHDMLLTKTVTPAKVDAFINSNAQQPLGSEPLPPGTPTGEAEAEPEPKATATRAPRKRKPAAKANAATTKVEAAPTPDPVAPAPTPSVNKD